MAVDSWSDPAPLKRAWCVLELHAVTSEVHYSLPTALLLSDDCTLQVLAGRGCFELAFPPEENRAFIANLKSLGAGGVVDAQADAYYQMLGRIRSEAAECSRIEDRQTIHQDIVDTIGFVKLDRTIFSVLERWLEKQIQQELYKAIADGNAQDADTMQEARANMLAEQGDYRSISLHPFRDLNPSFLCAAMPLH